MLKNVFNCKPEFDSSKNTKIYEKAYNITAIVQSARDLCKEYISARIWPLKKGWAFARFHKKNVKRKDYLYPDNDVSRPKEFSKDEEFVSAVELKAVRILGKFLKKEKDLIDRILGKDYKRLNRVFEIA